MTAPNNQQAPDMRAALDPHGSAWVGANAGAGKTYILVSRLARLMLEGAAPEQILCLTYTRAAAAEMQTRLFELLGEWALLDEAALRAAVSARLGGPVDDAALARARILFARALETPGGLRVQTIHGFCESLLKRFPLEAGLSPHFDLLDEQEARSLQAGLIADLLRPANDGPQALAQGLARLTRALAEPDILALGRQIIARRAHFEERPMAERLAALAKAMQLELPVPQAEDLLKGFRADSGDIFSAARAWLAEGGKTDRAQAARLGAWLGADKDGFEAVWPELRAVYFKTSGDMGMRASFFSNASAAKNPQLAEKFDALAVAVGALDGKLKALTNFRLTEAVYLFAEALLAAYAAAKTRRAVLDYEDLIAATNRLLHGPQAAQWVLYKIDAGLHHILIDEAQDTSPAQWQIVTALADAFFDDAGLSAAQQTARTIFAVGDEKQSIFSFQGADPKGFDAQRRYFEQAVSSLGGNFARLPMRQSRRSAPEILAAVDLVFAGHSAGVTADGTAMTHIAFRSEAVGHVEIWPPSIGTAKSSDTEPWDIPTGSAVHGRDILADEMADKIAALVGDARQHIDPGDILVLVRKRDAFVHALSRALKRRQIAVAGSDRMVLLEQIVIADILAAVDFALNPTDDMALAIFLRSPLGGISEAELAVLALGRSGSLWQALEEKMAQETPANLSAAYEKLLWLRRKIDFLSPYELLAQFLGAEGGHRLLSARLGPEIDDPLGELLRLALAFEARQAASMQGFVHWLRQGSQDIKRDMEAGGGAVRIMTVHGAKGLEAPIVFLPDTCRPAKKRGGAPDRLQFDAARAPLWRANQALRDPHNAAQADAADAASQEEEKRLLYVAMTRACERLYIAGWLGARDGKSGPPADSWYAMIDGALDEKTRAILAGGEHSLPKGEAETDLATPEETRPAPDWVHAPPAPAATSQAGGAAYIGTKIFSPSGLDAPATEMMAEIKNATPEAKTRMAEAAKRGQLIHKLLEVLPPLPPDARAEAGRRFLNWHGDMAESDVLMPEALLNEALAVMAQPELADLFSPRGIAEAPIAGSLTMDDGSSLTLSGQIDRLVETPDAFLLVDFKTGTPPEAGHVPKAYLTQMTAYRALLQAAQSEPKKPVRCALIWTQTGRIDLLEAADMDAALADITASGGGSI